MKTFTFYGAYTRNREVIMDVRTITLAVCFVFVWFCGLPSFVHIESLGAAVPSAYAFPLNLNPLPGSPTIVTFGTAEDDSAQSIALAGAGGTDVYIAGQVSAVMNRNSAGDGFVCQQNALPSECTSPPATPSWTTVGSTGTEQQILSIVANGASMLMVGKTWNHAVDSSCANHGRSDGFVSVRPLSALGAASTNCAQYATTNNDEALDVALDTSGPTIYAYVVGTKGDTSAGQQDGYVVRYDANNMSNSAALAEFTIDGSALLEVFTVTVGPDHVYVSGRTEDDLVAWCNLQTSASGNCFGGDGTDTDMYVAAFTSDPASGLTLAWLFQLAMNGHSAGQDILYLESDTDKRLVVVGGIDELNSPNGCTQGTDKYTDAYTMLIELDSSGMYTTNTLELSGVCNKGESFQAVTANGNDVYVIGVIRGPNYNCGGHCPAVKSEDGLVLKLLLSNTGLSYVDDVVFEGNTIDNSDRLYDLVHDGTNLHIVGKTKSQIGTQVRNGGYDALYVMFPY